MVLKKNSWLQKGGLIETVLIPEENEKDFFEISDEIKDGFNIIPLKNVKAALEFVLEEHPGLAQDQEIIVPNISWSNSTEETHAS